MKTINISTFFNNEPNNKPERVKVGADETAFVPFTFEAEPVPLHYCNEPEVRDYVRCNGSECLLCRIGKKMTEMLLLPGYLPASRQIGILPVNKSLNPGALLPQFGAVEAADKRVGLFISKPDRFTYIVSTFELKEDMDKGEGVIARFVKDYEEGKVDLGAVYQRLSNEQLTQVPAIERLLKLKGLMSDADNPAA